jgi:HemY protein
MIRVVVFLVLTGGFVYYVAVWLAGLPGEVPVTWLGYRADVPVGLFSAAVASTAVLAWSLFRFLVHAPRRLAAALASRRAEAGQRAIMHGLMAIGAGDAGAARRFAAKAGRLVPEQPLLLMLQAQTAQLSGASESAATAFRAMADRSDTRLFGLHGLFIEAQRCDDLESAREYAEAAAKASPSLAWAGHAALEFRCRDGDWPGALEALERNRRGGLVQAGAYRRQRAVLLTAQALALKDSNPYTASDLVQEAANLAPDLVPATALAGRLLAEAGDPRKAARMLEAGWRRNPHPDIANEYVDLVPGASARDRLARMRQLAKLSDHPHRESALALAYAAFDAKEFAEARDGLAPFLATPTRRVATLMARIEAAENGDTGRAREWMARAVHAAHDPAWTADGVIAERWMPVSPVTGRLDAFQWRVPVADLTLRGPLIEEVAMEREAMAPSPAPVAVPAPAAPPQAVPVEAPIPPLVADKIVDVSPAAPPAELPVPKPAPKEPARVNGPADLAPARLPDDPGSAGSEPALDPVPKPSSEFARGLLK